MDNNSPITADSILQDIAGSSTLVTTTTPATNATQTEPEKVTTVPKDSTATNSSQPNTSSTPPVKKDEPAAQSTPEDVSGIITDWDSEPASTTADAPVTFDFSSIGKAIDVEVKTQEDLVNQFKALKAENETLKKSTTASEQVFANDVLKEANEIAKSNGDYLGFLGVAAINYDAVDSRVLLEGEIRGYFPQGPEGDEEMKAYLDSMEPAEVNIRGSQIRQQYKISQEQSKLRVAQNLEAKKTADVERKKLMDTQLSQSLEKVKDVDGFVLNPSHKKQLYSDLSSGEVFKKHFYTDGKYDFDKAIKAAFILNEYNKVTGYLRNKAKLEGKRDVINNLTNAELNRTTSTVSSNTEVKSSMDEWFDRMKSGNK